MKWKCHRIKLLLTTPCWYWCCWWCKGRDNSGHGCQNEEGAAIDRHHYYWLLIKYYDKKNCWILEIDDAMVEGPLIDGLLLRWNVLWNCRVVGRFGVTQNWQRCVFSNLLRHPSWYSYIGINTKYCSADSLQANLKFRIFCWHLCFLRLPLPLEFTLKELLLIGIDVALQSSSSLLSLIIAYLTSTN